MYKKYIDPTYEYSNFTVEEQDKILVAKRSNNTLVRACWVRIAVARRKECGEIIRWVWLIRHHRSMPHCCSSNLINQRPLSGRVPHGEGSPWRGDQGDTRGRGGSFRADEVKSYCRRHFPRQVAETEQETVIRPPLADRFLSPFLVLTLLSWYRNALGKNN